MRPSPLIIENYFVKKIQLELNPGFDRSNEPERSETEANIRVDLESEKYPEDLNRWRFELSVHSNEVSPEDSPFTFDVILVGIFRVDESFPEDKADMLAQINAPSVLYSAARELIISITSRSSYSPILLPSVSFVPEAEKEAEKKETSPVKSVKRIAASSKTKIKK